MYRPDWALAVGCMAVAVCGVALAQEPAPSIDVAAVIERLSSPERAERIAAEQELLDAGPAVLGALPNVESITDPATRGAILRIRKRLEDQQAVKQVEGTRFGLREVHTFGEALRAIEDRMGSTNGEVFELTPDQAAKGLMVDEVERGFWEWVDLLAEQSKLWPIEAEKGRIAFRERQAEDEAKRIDYAKAFRVVADRVELRPIAGNAEGRLARVTMKVRGEPKLRPLFLAYAARDLSLTSAAGKEFAPFTPNAKYELPLGEAGQEVEFQLNYAVPAEEVAVPLTLKGKLTATVAAGEEDFSFPLLGDASQWDEKSRGGVTVRLAGMSVEQGGAVEVEIAVIYERGGPAFESYRTWVYHNVAYLEATVVKEGVETTVRIDHEPEFATLAQSDGGVMLRYRFEEIPKAAKSIAFHYHAPTNIVDVPLELEIEGLDVMGQSSRGRERKR